MESLKTRRPPARGFSAAYEIIKPGIRPSSQLDVYKRQHYTSAHDMALITSEATKHEEFRKISGTSRYILRATNKKSEELLMNNHHYMISGYKTSKYLDPTVFAGKTGYTTAAVSYTHLVQFG